MSEVSDKRFTFSSKDEKQLNLDCSSINVFGWRHFETFKHLISVESSGQCIGPLHIHKWKLDGKIFRRPENKRSPMMFYTTGGSSYNLYSLSRQPGENGLLEVIVIDSSIKAHFIRPETNIKLFPL